jgi:hypothetical protein
MKLSAVPNTRNRLPYAVQNWSSKDGMPDETDSEDCSYDGDVLFFHF